MTETVPICKTFANKKKEPIKIIGEIKLAYVCIFNLPDPLIIETNKFPNIIDRV